MTRTNAFMRAALACVVLAPIGGCEPSKPVTTIRDLESQLTRQVREQWPNVEFSTLRITEFRNPMPDCDVRISVDITWPMKPGDTHTRSLGVGIPLYRAADDYLVGTLGTKDRPPVNVVLKFE